MAVTANDVTNKKQTANNKLNQNSSSGGNTKKDRHFSHPKLMVYPSARGKGNITGDTLLIKCFEYIPPQTTSSLKYRLQFASKKGKKDGVTQTIL